MSASASHLRRMWRLQSSAWNWHGALACQPRSGNCCCSIWRASDQLISSRHTASARADRALFLLCS